MKIILAFTDAYRLDPAGRSEREEEARQQFADAGIELDSRRCHQITAGKNKDEAANRLEQSLRVPVETWRDGDLAYSDYEPDNYSLFRSYDEKMVALHAELIDGVKQAVPDTQNVSVYGLPYSRWWSNFSTQQAMFGLARLHQKTPLGWFGPQFYQGYNLGDKPGLDNLKRALTMRNICAMIDPAVPIYPFVQPVIRNPINDYAELSDETIFDSWQALAWAGINTVTWWYESGPEGQTVAGHADRIKRHAPIINEAVQSTLPGKT